MADAIDIDCGTILDGMRQSIRPVFDLRGQHPDDCLEKER